MIMMMENEIELKADDNLPILIPSIRSKLQRHISSEAVDAHRSHNGMLPNCEPSISPATSSQCNKWIRSLQCNLSIRGRLSAAAAPRWPECPCYCRASPLSGAARFFTDPITFELHTSRSITCQPCTVRMWSPLYSPPGAVHMLPALSPVD